MRMGLYLAMVGALLALAVGCAGQRRGEDRVIVDMQGVDRYAYRQDLADCEAYADEVRVGRRAAGGAVAGAVIGGAVGAIAGDHHTAERAAGVGGVVGGAKGVGSGLRERDRVVKNCLRGRGYRVLN
ncbi:MAG TPA: glycine zipper family protein [Porticoccaceae bacterium]|nr:glycine zipper family protein [Porticoccaceae bacterium]